MPDATLDEVRERGFALVEGFLAPDELTAAQQALWLHFPTPEDYFADPAAYRRVRDEPVRRGRGVPLPVVGPQPSGLPPRSGRRRRALPGYHRAASLQGRAVGQVRRRSDYDQPLHRDYGSHSLVVPRHDGRYQQLTTFIFLSDVTEEDGPTRIVPFERGKDVPFTPLYIEFGALADAEVPAVGPAGSLLIYRTDILHRGSNLTGAGRSRFSLLADYQARGTTWGGKMAWPKQAPQRWAKLMPQCTRARARPLRLPAARRPLLERADAGRRRRPLSGHGHDAVPAGESGTGMTGRRIRHRHVDPRACRPVDEVVGSI